MSRRRMRTYPGGHADKQAARMFLYRHVRAAPVQGHAVTLAGTEPESELSLLRHYVQWPAEHVWFVDNSLRPQVTNALLRAKRKWPEANVERINVSNLIPRLGAIGFANLDFMGAPLQDDTIGCFKQVAECLLPQGVIGFTWLRGRENFDNPSTRRLYRLGKGEGDERRWTGVVRAVRQLSRGALTLVGRWDYYSHHSPMSVAVFRKE